MAPGTKVPPKQDAMSAADFPLASIPRSLNRLAADRAGDHLHLKAWEEESKLVVRRALAVNCQGMVAWSRG